MRRVCLAIGMGLLGLALTSPALAQTPTGDAATHQARALFDEGVQLLNEQVYDAALAKFEASKKAFATRVARQNIAIVLKILGRYEEAAEEIEDTLRAYPAMKPEDRAVLTRLADEVEAHLGQVAVAASEDGSNVFVDSRPYGPTPRAAIRLTEGAHILRLTKPGFESRETEIAIAPGRQQKISLTLVPLVKSGRLRVSEAQGHPLAVFVDGGEVGTTPWEGSVSTGLHAIQLRGRDAQGSPLAEVEIQEQQLATLTLLAEPMHCGLRVVPTPASARVLVDGVSVGTGAWSGPLRCGGHRVEVTAQEFVNSSHPILLSEEREGLLRVVLERDPGYGRVPTRITSSGALGVMVTPSFGGTPSSACGANCSSPLGIGGFVTADAGVRFGTGLGVGVNAGYLSLGKTYEGRDASATPTGRAPNVGTSDDTLNISGPRLGLSASFERGSTWKLGAVVSGGAFFARWTTQRDLSLSTAGPGTTYPITGVRDRGTLVAPFVAPGLSVGYEVARLVTIDLGISALMVFGLERATSDASDQYHAGVCTTDADRADRSRCPGVLQFESESLFASVLVTGALSAGVTARF